MSTHDYNIANASGASVRSDINNALGAILSNNSNASSPSTTVAYMLWADTSANKLKIRNSANDAWVDLINLDGTIARDLTLTGASANIVFDQSANELQFADTVKAVFGNGSDLTIHHNGSNSIINDSGTGELLLQRAGNTVLSLKADGIDITDPDGNTHITIIGFENSDAILGLQADEGDDNGDVWRIVSVASDNDFILTNNIDGSNAQKWAINTSGDVEQTGHLSLPDSKKIKLGAANDLTLEHDGTNSIINDGGTGELLLQRAGNTILSLTATGIDIFDPNGTTFVKIKGFEGSHAKLALMADEGDDNGDTWTLQSDHSNNNFVILNDINGSAVEKLSITTAGETLIGATSSVNVGSSSSSLLQIAHASGNISAAFYSTVNASGPSGVLALGHGRSTVTGALQDDDILGQIRFAGGDGTDCETRELISCEVDGTVSSGNVPTRLVFSKGGIEKMRLTSSGHLMLNTTAAAHSETRLTISGSDHLATLVKSTNSNKSCLQMQNGRASGSTLGTMINFRNEDGNSIGTIKGTSSATQYNTSSDYRLKENVTAISDGITRLKTLKPYRFNFKNNPDRTVDGFFAHEVTAVPEAITEEKDAVITQSMIDSGDAPDGEVGDPIYQEMDQSKLVPLLTAALQESISKIETLETKVAALEAA